MLDEVKDARDAVLVAHIVLFHPLVPLQVSPEMQYERLFHLIDRGRT